MASIQEIRQKYPQYADIEDGELVRALHRKFYSDMPYQDFLKRIDFREQTNPTEGMTGGEKALAGAGQAFVSANRGQQQVEPGAIAGLPQPLKSAGIFALHALRKAGLRQMPEQIKRETDQAKELDAPLLKTGAGMAGNIGGNVALLAPTAFAPGANTLRGAAAIGAAAGALQPVGEGDSRAMNTAAGGFAGLVGQAVGGLLGRAVRPVVTKPSPQRLALAKIAADEGIPLDAAAVTGSKPLATMESVFEQLPITAGKQATKVGARQTAFNRAVGRKVGVDADALTPEVMGNARTAIGQKFTDLSARNRLNVTDDMLDSLAAQVDDLNRYEVPEVTNVVKSRVQQVLDKIEAGDTISGEAYRKLDSALGQQMRATSKGDLRHALGQLRDTLRAAMDDSISPQDQAAWREARRQYANLMTVAPEVAKSAEGNVSGRSLLAATMRASKETKFGGGSELADLGRVGREFVGDATPNSGTAQRQFYQNLLTGTGIQGGGAALGAGGAMATGNDPLAGAMVGAGLTAGSMLAPRAVQSVVHNPAFQNYMVRGAVNPGSRQALAELLAAAARTGAIALPFSGQ